MLTSRIASGSLATCSGVRCLVPYQVASLPSSCGERHSERARRHVAVCADKFCKDMISAPKAPSTSQGNTFKLTFQGAGGQNKYVDCPDDTYVLTATDAAGIDLPATCRGGICGSCVARLAAGTVDQSDVDDLLFTLTQEEIDQGMVLLCMARPTSDCTIETQSDWGYSLGIDGWKGATGKFTYTPDPLMGTHWNTGEGEQPPPPSS